MKWTLQPMLASRMLSMNIAAAEFCDAGRQADGVEMETVLPVRETPRNDDAGEDGERFIVAIRNGDAASGERIEAGQLVNPHGRRNIRHVALEARFGNLVEPRFGTILGAATHPG